MYNKGSQVNYSIVAYMYGNLIFSSTMRAVSSEYIDMRVEYYDIIQCITESIYHSSIEKYTLSCTQL